MTNFFKSRRDIPSSPWIKQSHLGKCSNGKLHTSSLVNDGTVRSTQSTADFPSALTNGNNVKISDLLEFIVIFLFSSFCSHPKIVCRMLQNYENIHAADSFLIISSHFYLQLCKNKLLITFQQVDVSLMKKSKVMN